MKRFWLSLIMTAGVLTASAVIPDVSLQNPQGRKVNVATLAQTGKPVIISFFATWCKPCMRELKAMHELYPEWQDETGVEIYIVSTDQAQDAHKVQPLVDGNGWEYQVLLDPDGAFKRAMNVQNIPHLFVLNSKGEVVYSHVGYTEGDEEALRKYLK